MIFLGSFVMVIGTIIQVTAYGAHKGFLQFMIGRVSLASSVTSALTRCLPSPETT
jgi:hypothetical protein